MAAFSASSGYARQLANRAGPRSVGGYTPRGPFINDKKLWVNYMLAYNKAKANYEAAKKKYNNQKRNVSGGLRGWINRRKYGNIGEQARKLRNNQLNAQLKRNMNNAKARIEKVNKNGRASKNWYNQAYGQERGNAKYALDLARGKPKHVLDRARV
jgi:hypothetical protein